MQQSGPTPLRFQATRATRAADAAPRTFAAEWDALADRLGAPPFLRAGWFEAWHRAYGQGELRVLEVREDGRLTGVLPVEVQDRGVRSATNSHTPLYGPLAEDADAERGLLAQLLELGGRTLELSYANRRATWTGELEKLLRGASRAVRRSVLMETQAHPPYVLTEAGWDAYCATLSRKFVKDIRRRRRRLEEQGSVSIEVQRTLDGLDEALAEFFELEPSGWKEDAGTAIASRDSSPRFYADVARWAVSHDALRIYSLRVGGRAIAAEFDLDWAGARYSLKSGFSPEYRSYGPGQLLTYECLHDTFTEGLRSYEFLGTDEPYKMNWTDSTHELVRIRSFPRTVTGDLRAIRHHRARPLIRRLKRIP